MVRMKKSPKETALTPLARKILSGKTPAYSQSKCFLPVAAEEASATRPAKAVVMVARYIVGSVEGVDVTSKIELWKVPERV